MSRRSQVAREQRERQPNQGTRGPQLEETLESRRQRERLEFLEKNANTPLKIISSPTTHQYPLTLENKEEFVHSVIFYINARSNTRVGAASASQLANNNDFKRAQVALGEQYASENRLRSESADTFLATAGVLATGAAAYTASKTFFEGASPGGKIMETGFLGAAAAGVANISSEASSTVRLLSAIELYVSAPPSAEYAAEWQNADIGALAGSLASGGIGANGADINFKNVLEDAASLGQFGFRSIIQAGAAVPREFGITGDIGAGIEATSKKVANPYREQLFKNMGFRSFGFSYKFNPRNTSELTSVMEIIQLFKYHMHPEIDPSRLFLIYPSEFNIEYRYKGKRNEYIHKISTCALTNVRVTYGSSDFTTFSGMNGAPSEINLDLTFSELETLSNDRIGQKWGDSY
jgi:hypothetical protein